MCVDLCVSVVVFEVVVLLVFVFVCKGEELQSCWRELRSKRGRFVSIT